MIMIIIIIIMWDSQTRSKQLSQGSFAVPMLAYPVLSYPILPYPSGRWHLCGELQRGSVGTLELLQCLLLRNMTINTSC